jgi:hypothetical protein
VRIAALLLIAGWTVVTVRPAGAGGEEMQLLVLANQARQAANVPPLIWNDDLAEAALAHSEDLAAHGGNCDLHNSCNGELWYKRVQRYYPGWVALGENVATSVSDPQILHDGWMSSSGHRANILNSNVSDFGAGIALGQTNFGKLAFATEDFGSRGMLSATAYPALPGGSVQPQSGTDAERDLSVTFYSASGGAPQAVRALVGTGCVNLSLQAGKATYGTYAASRSFTGSGCVPVVFEAIKADGSRHRFPKNEAILVGVGAGGAYCAERTTSVPTQDCGGPNTNPTPTPTPTPAPTPTPDPSRMNKLRVTLKPGKSNASEGVVQISAKLPRIANFDPTSGPITIDLSFGRNGDWSQTLRQLCGAKPCLEINKKATSYRAKYDANTSLTLAQQKDGTWMLRFTARGETLAGLADGTVDVAVTIDGQTFTASGDGEMKTNGLFVD